MTRAYYSDSIANFCTSNPEEILGKLSKANQFPLEQSQRDAWLEEINILKKDIGSYKGSIYFEYSIPRMGQRIDVVLLIGPVIFVLEFKVGEDEFVSHAIDQVWDYALDLKNFHESSHNHYVAPVLIATKATVVHTAISVTSQNDKLLFPIKCNAELLGKVIEDTLYFADDDNIDRAWWEAGRYCPTPNIIEAALSLYNGHSVADISRSDAIAVNLHQTTDTISNIISQSKSQSCKSICFVTGVPGAGKTLVGLNIATTHIEKANDLYSVYLSGNGPLVEILREALARDKVLRTKKCGGSIKKGEAMSEVKAFIQNVHHFRDDCLIDMNLPPIEHVALFDEAQRAWDIKQTANFMKRKASQILINQSRNF